MFLKFLKSLIDLPLVSDWINDNGRFNMVYDFGQVTRYVLLSRWWIFDCEIAIDLRAGSFILDFFWLCLVPSL